jgi:UDP-N-acetylmuramoyl-tripeptide--D-alanyl-D-alanine ligase
LVILGDMLELGEQTDREHLAILELLNGLQFTHVFLVGPVFQRLNRNAGWISFPTSQEAKTWFARHPVEDMAILLKGSRGIRLEEIIGSL